VWGGTLLAGVAAGTVIGYTQVAPAVISWLAQDTLGANMVIAYRIRHYAWLIVYTTVGIGLLAEIPMTLLLFHYGGLVSFTAVWDRWREIVIAIFAFAALVSPSGMFTMLVLAIPISLSFFLGLTLLWALTLGGRRETEDAEVAD
jgi:sec-independent protein translocase protein TatC